MKKKFWITVMAIVLILLIIPIPTGIYKDGGTRTFTALTYKIVNWNHIHENGIYQAVKIYPFPMNFMSLDTLLSKEEQNFAKEKASTVKQNDISYDFSAQYIRTDGYHDDINYPLVKIIKSVEELQNYYEDNKQLYNLEPKEKAYSDTTIGFLNACNKYDDNYFEKQILIMVLLQESSGSNRHEVTGVIQNSNGDVNIDIIRKIPEIGTCDMAAWHILIEPKEKINIEKETDIIITLDGKEYRHTHQMATEPQTVDNPTIGYCGNTQTTIYFEDGYKYTFEGGNSVTLTDILINLKYDPMKVCKCLPEYKVDTEFGTDYGISLGEDGGYARCDKGQADLTKEQNEKIASIIKWAKTQVK